MERRKLKPGCHELTIRSPSGGVRGYDQCPIALLDALGFSNAMEKGDLQDAYSRYMFLVMNVRVRMRACPKCEMLVFSDTIFMVPGSDQLDCCLQSIVENVCTMMHNSITCIKVGFPLRGAVSFGSVVADFAHEMTVDFNPPLPVRQAPFPAPVILGEPVIIAHRWQQLQKWVGASIAPESIRPVEEAFPESLWTLRNRNMLLDWDIPTEHGPVPSLAVNYVSRSSAETLEEQLVETEREAPNLAVRAKYHASLAFVRHVIKYCLYSRSGVDEK